MALVAAVAVFVCVRLWVFFWGFVGRGMLSAAVAGNVFASPSVDAILSAIRCVTCPGAPGCLVIVKN